MTRICITGGPNTGKTTLAEHLALGGTYADGRTGPGRTLGQGKPPRHTDDLIEQCKHLGKDAWSEASRIVSTWFDEPGPWIIEGVAIPRALRKWKEAHPGEPPPVDRVIRLTTPHVPLSPGQRTMAKGEETVWQEIAGWLLGEGVTVDPLSSVDV